MVRQSNSQHHPLQSQQSNQLYHLHLLHPQIRVYRIIHDVPHLESVHADQANHTYDGKLDEHHHQHKKQQFHDSYDGVA